MQRKGYVPGAAALLAVLLTACSGGAGTDDPTDDAKPGEASATQTAEPGRYRTLPDACRAVEHGTLDRMLPGLRQLDQEQRTKAYEGTAAATYDTDRRVGCSWKVDSPDATHHLDVDFERVVSYDGAVSDDARAEEVYGQKEEAADLPEPSPGTEGAEEDSGSPSTDASGSADATESTDPEKTGDTDKADKADKAGDKTAQDAKSPEKADADKTSDGKTDDPKPGDGKNPDADADTDTGADEDTDNGTGTDDDTGTDGEGEAVVPDELLPRVLTGLGDQAFVDDRLTSAGSTVRHRTVTVVFRTSNVVVTVQYGEQPARGTELPDSKELQDRARELAGRLAEQFAD
ncbi:DUF3558 domain-containing protein [Streptomyces sp. Da 82-17]|uniref:DUF3558 domain-containing protein n=1 Tax=Streptomyces sp. Da 82-17 TaxID=3377116 RepID=UPI0038D415AB